jgi:YbbR domain-containing protein
MTSIWKAITRYLPSFILAFILAVAVWISAVTAADPVEERVYPQPVTVDIVGQDPRLVITSDLPPQVSITLSAPQSIWTRITNEQVAVRAVADLSGLKAGKYNVPITVQVGIRPVEVITYNPRSFSVTLEELTSRTLPIQFVAHGDPAVGFLAEASTLSQNTATISGPKSAVDRVSQVVAELDLTGATETINRSITIQALDAAGNPVTGVTITPDHVTAQQIITQRGGYRNVVVKVIVVGQVATGYRLTNITVSPPAVTVFSSNPQLVNYLPGYIETDALNLNNVKADFDTRLQLNLPQGISVVGDQSVLVQVGVAPIMGSLTFTGNRVVAQGLPSNLFATFSPETVDVILSGPLPVLDQLTTNNLQVFVDLSDVTQPGNYQRTPQVTLLVPDLTVESILPQTVEVTVTIGPPPTPTPLR